MRYIIALRYSDVIAQHRLALGSSMLGGIPIDILGRKNAIHRLLL